MGITIGTLNLLNPAFALESSTKKIKTNEKDRFKTRIIETINFFSKTLSLDVICLQESKKFSDKIQNKLKQFKTVEKGLNDGLAILYNKDKFESRKCETHQLADGNLKVLLLDLEEKTTKKVIRIAHCYFKDTNNQNIPFDELLQRVEHNLTRVANEPQEQQEEVQEVQGVANNAKPIENNVDQTAIQIPTEVKLLKSHSRVKVPKRRLPTRKPLSERVLENRQQVHHTEAAPQHAIQSQVIVFDYKSKATQDFNAKFTPLTNANYRSNHAVLPAEASSINGIWVKNQQNLPSVNTTMPFSDKMKLYSVTIQPVNEPEAEELPINLVNEVPGNEKPDANLKKIQETTPQKKVSLLRRIFACLLRVFSCCYKPMPVR